MNVKQLLGNRSFVVVIALVLLVPMALYVTVAGMGATPIAGDVLGSSAADEAIHFSEEMMALDEGESGDFAIPYVGVNVLETDVKHHWDMPADKIKVRAMVNWQGTGWDFNFDIGVGECPHSGEARNSTSGDSGELVLEYSAADGEVLDEGQWFVHLGDPDVASHRGESTTYTFTV